METEDPLTCAKQPASGPYSVVEVTGTEHHTLFFHGPFSYHFPPTSKMVKWYLPFRSSN